MVFHQNSWVNWCQLFSDLCRSFFLQERISMSPIEFGVPIFPITHFLKVNLTLKHTPLDWLLLGFSILQPLLKEAYLNFLSFNILLRCIMMEAQLISTCLGCSSCENPRSIKWNLMRIFKFIILFLLFSLVRVIIQNDFNYRLLLLYRE